MGVPSRWRTRSIAPTLRSRLSIAINAPASSTAVTPRRAVGEPVGDARTLSGCRVADGCADFGSHGDGKSVDLCHAYERNTYLSMRTRLAHATATDRRHWSPFWRDRSLGPR